MEAQRKGDWVNLVAGWFGLRKDWAGSAGEGGLGGIQDPKGFPTSALTALDSPQLSHLPQLLSCCCSSWPHLTFQSACQGPLRLGLPQDESGALWGWGARMSVTDLKS